MDKATNPVILNGIHNRHNYLEPTKLIRYQLSKLQRGSANPTIMNTSLGTRNYFCDRDVLY
jgi:hypothetical protein